MLVRDKRSLEFTVTRSLEAISDWICKCCQRLHELFSFLASQSSNRYSYGQIFGKISCVAKTIFAHCSKTKLTVT